MIIEFSVHGLPWDDYGNPQPKLKMTGKQSWTKKAQRYVAWKKHVQNAFEDVTDHIQDVTHMVDWSEKKPLVTGKKKVRMEIMIYWKNHAHGDPENIFGSIADAIFLQDKYLAGSFNFEEKPTGKGRVDIKIIC